MTATSAPATNSETAASASIAAGRAFDRQRAAASVEEEQHAEHRQHDRHAEMQPMLGDDRTRQAEHDEHAAEQQQVEEQLRQDVDEQPVDRRLQEGRARVQAGGAPRLPRRKPRPSSTVSRPSRDRRKIRVPNSVRMRGIAPESRDRSAQYIS